MQMARPLVQNDLWQAALVSHIQLFYTVLMWMPEHEATQTQALQGLCNLPLRW